MTGLGAIFAVLAVSAAVAKPQWLPWLLSAAVAFPASQAVGVAGFGLSPFYLLALACVLAVLNELCKPRYRRRRQGPRPGRSMWLAFVWVSVAVTAMAPALFAGIHVLTARGGIDAQIKDPDSLSFSTSNLAQIVYLLLAAAVVGYLARLPSLSERVVSLGLGLGLGLSALRWLTEVQLGVPWPTKWFETASVLYLDSSFNGVPRLRGVFSEPSELAAFALAGAAYFLCAAWRSRGGACAWNLAGAAVAVLDLYLSLAGTAVVSAVVVGTLAIVVAVGSRLSGSTRITLRGCVMALVLAGAAFRFGPSLYAAVADLMQAKVLSDSYSVRTASLTFSWGVLGDTLGLGAGLGSNRPASFAFLLLSCTGVVGTVLIAMALWSVISRAWKRPGFRPAVWALIALLVAKVIAAPDLSTPLFWLLFAVCAHAAWQSGEVAEDRLGDGDALDLDGLDEGAVDFPHVEVRLADRA